jgi:hypothetical protein
MDAIFKKIKYDVYTRNWDNNFEKLLTEKVFLMSNKCELDKYENFYKIPCRGDLVVGFYLDPLATSSSKISISIDGIKYYNNKSIAPGEFIYFFESSIFPIISLQHSEIHIKLDNSYNDLKIIYALINDNKLIGNASIRKYLATITNTININNIYY